MSDLIAYRRVSTKMQGASGLGLDGQLEALQRYSLATGQPIKAIYTEVESGKNNERPELAKALAHAKRNKATLVVAKLDRLSRNVAFLSALMESGADFVACDLPNANRLTLHIMIAVAQAEAEAISSRTKAALEALKARGVALGSARPGHWDGKEDRRQYGADKGNQVSAQVRSRKAKEAVADLLPLVEAARSQGDSLQTIADRLNAEGHRTARGAAWGPMQIKRLLEMTA